MIHFYLGGFSASEGQTIKDILEFNQKDEKWTKIGAMMEAKENHGISIIDFDGYEKHCT